MTKGFNKKSRKSKHNNKKTNRKNKTNKTNKTNKAKRKNKKQIKMIKKGGATEYVSACDLPGGSCPTITDAGASLHNMIKSGLKDCVNFD